ncbi:serine hydrolase [Taibaiella koreensis]|uniref:serine hydrolase n=1 Tax=Taibaiella koreensis TaxID=1268548 RepID=UPI000E59DE8B|nr:serine hydrolase [Taibaiella koreensis]
MIRYHCLLLFLLGLTAGTVSGQPATTPVSGIVTDSVSGAPLEGVSVGDQKGNGTITNREGRFVLYLPAPADFLYCSMLGYALQKTALTGAAGWGNLHINMATDPTMLTEVVIRDVSALSIVQRAIKAIPAHYLARGHVQHGFYRVATKRDAAYIQLSEAVFDIYHYGYGSPKTSQLRLEKMRALKDEQQSHGIDLGLRPESLFEYDALQRVADHPLLDKKGLRKHRFTLDGVVNYKGQQAYKIDFDQIEGLHESLYRGTIYILTQDDIIVAMDYGLSPRGLAYAQYGSLAYRGLLQLMGLSIQLKKEENHIEYRAMGDKWVLSNVRNNTVLRFRSKRRQYDFTADATVDYVTTGIDTMHSNPFPATTILGNGKFIEHQEIAPDTQFWKNYTIVLPDFPVDTVIRRINAANESNNLKQSAARSMKQWQKQPGEIDSLLSFYAGRGQFNGTAFVVHNDQLVLDKSYGYADRTAKRIADKHTRYRIGSLSKAFTAIVILQLAREGKLALDAPVGRYLPGYKHPGITVSQLLTHTSGLPNCTGNPAYITALMDRPLPRQDIIGRFCSDPLEADSVATLHYSNSGYMLLAFLAETLEQKDFATILSERIFTPLGMHETYLGWAPQQDNTVRGYLYGEPEKDYPVTNLAGAGGITSTAWDLWLWYKGLQSGKLLTAQERALMYEPKASYIDWNAGYGYGWMTDKGLFAISSKDKVRYHPGTDFGCYTMLAQVEGKGDLVILLNNTGDFPRFDLTDLILSSLDKK